ncbi:putative transcriptional regulators, CopG/Arc/MetJ family [Halorhabdus utahensis DSM 12940]|uniref:Putative transcriptional regulators, CopG/Arc/MetJ family n=1 Tax=Halorhabdus utahensis (strain DSM 12940 / JCM 11049 / AX-2) TaxID=519442 RepID=C7NMN1_HALUD|nr:ribbon-helix-helix domain-containing protein [Halorhabdus utahensis]ACV11344.1 putative transcriptional regulators, CopG/Arc/MetJ family [Halorhabdus utahensis DSM 12940]
MPKVSISLPDRIENDIERLVDQGEFVNRDQAVEELLTMGVSAYDTGEDEPEVAAEDDFFSQTVEDQQDPALHDDDPDDGYTF